MTSWNMPPGCNVSDIPGNGPEDQTREAVFDEIYTILAQDTMAEKIFQLLTKHWNEGYERGIGDALQGRDYLLEEIAEYLEDRQDVNWHGTGPNKAMSLLQQINEVLNRKRD